MNRPPKNMISVTRNTHMPSVDASACCSMLSKWCCRYGWCGAWPAPAAWTATGAGYCGNCSRSSLSDNADLMARSVLVGSVRHDGRRREILGRRRRGNLPLEAARAPRVVPGERRVLQGPGEIDHRDQVADAKDGRAGGG